MTKVEARKLARLEAENAELRATLERVQGRSMDNIRREVSWRIAIDEIEAVIKDAREFAA